jgi:hypothetical protein
VLQDFACCYNIEMVLGIIRALQSAAKNLESETACMRVSTRGNIDSVRFLAAGLTISLFSGDRFLESSSLNLGELC